MFHTVNFCGRGSVVLSGVVSLISLWEHSKVALFSICVDCLVIFGFYLLVAHFLWFSPPAGFTAVH